MSLERGYLFVFEGIDGSGKSSHCKLMGETFRQQGFPVCLLREPTDGPWGKKIRRLLSKGRGKVTLEEELKWFMNDRREDVEQNILPALEEKTIVLLDRYYYSTGAYQGALGLDPFEIIKSNQEFAPMPDLTFILKVPVDVCLKRIRKSRHGVTDEFEKKDYLEKVQAVFECFQGPDIKAMDCSGGVETVRKKIMNEAIKRFPELTPRR